MQYWWFHWILRRRPVGFDPVLISRSDVQFNLVAYDPAGVQPMSGPTGLIFGNENRYENQSGSETFFDEVDTAFSGQDAGFDLSPDAIQRWEAGLVLPIQLVPTPVLNPVGSFSSTGYTVGNGMTTGESENLDGTGGDAFQPDGLLDRESHCYR